MEELKDVAAYLALQYCALAAGTNQKSLEKVTKQFLT
jgi:hypothetical protein